MSMSFLCTPCNCTFPLAYLSDKAIDNLWIHLNGNLHNQNRCWSDLQCLLCSEIIYTSGDLERDGKSAENHINSYSHQMNVKNHYDDNYTNNNDSSSGSYYDTTESDQYDDDDNADDEEDDDNSDDEDDDLPPSKMSFLCTPCGCYFPMSYNTDKTIDNLWTHLNGNLHEENRCYSTLQCILCNEAINTSGDLTIDGKRAENHINSYSHQMNVNSHYDDYHTNNNDSDSGSCSYDSTEPDQSDDDSDDEEENNSQFFHCCICSCGILVSSDVEKTLKQLRCHIEGQQHKNNVNQSGVEKSMMCNTCDRPISVSVDINSSIRNLYQHIISC